MEPARTQKEALLKTYPYRIELHAHTNPVSGCSEMPPAEMVKRCKEAGAHGVVVTNHACPWEREERSHDEWVSYYLNDYQEAADAGKELGIQVFLGMEMRFPEAPNDYLIYGADEALVDRAYDYLDKSLHDFYADFHGEDRLIIQAHPFRDGMQRIEPADVDGYEVFNCHPGHNSRISVAASYYAEHGGVATGGTDFHHRGHEGQIFACFKELPRTNNDLVRLLREGDYIFVAGNSVFLP